MLTALLEYINLLTGSQDNKRAQQNAQLPPPLRAVLLTSAVLFKLHCVISFPKLSYPPLSGLLHDKSIRVALPLTSLKSLKDSKTIIDLFTLKLAETMTIS